jgi:hypothetical protein
MRNRLARLLNNQDEEDHIGIISASEHILFGTGRSSCRKDKFILYDRDEIKEATLAIPQHEKPSMRHLSERLGLPLTTLFYLLKERVCKREAGIGEMIFRRRTIKLKPTLTEVKKVHRFMFAADKIKAVPNGVRGHVPTFGPH